MQSSPSLGARSRPTTATSSRSFPALARSAARTICSASGELPATDARPPAARQPLRRRTQDDAILPSAAGRTQGRARDVDRRDEPDDRGRARGDRQRPVARAAILATHRHDAPRDRARVASIRRSASRPRGASRAGRLLSTVGRARAAPSRRAHDAGDSRSRSRAARARACRCGRRTIRPRFAGSIEPPAAAYAQARELLAELGRRRDATASRRHGARDHAHGTADGRAADASAARAHGDSGRAVRARQLSRATSRRCSSERDPAAWRRRTPPRCGHRDATRVAFADRATRCRRASSSIGDALRRIRSESDRLRAALGDEWRAASTDRRRGERVGRAAAGVRVSRSDRTASRAALGAVSASKRKRRGAGGRADAVGLRVYCRGGAGRPAAGEPRSFSRRRSRSRTSSDMFGDQITLERRNRVGCARRVRSSRESASALGAIVLAGASAPERRIRRAVTAALLDGIRQAGIDALPWTRRRAIAPAASRVSARRSTHTWPDVSDAALMETLGDVARAAPAGRRDRSRTSAASTWRARCWPKLPWDQRAALDDLAPTHMVVPSGSRIPIDYSDPSAPVLAVRLQEMFGLADTPRIARGAVPLDDAPAVPAHRPVQVTRDLAGFWRARTSTFGRRCAADTRSTTGRTIQCRPSRLAERNRASGCHSARIESPG